MRKVPLIASALVLALGFAASAAEDDRAQIYRYTTKGGRPAYTNSLERVPPELRDTARRVDLSHISLNRDLGNALAQMRRQEAERLAHSSHCQAAQARTSRSWLQGLWAEQQGAVLLCGLGLLLLLLTPWVLSRFEAPRWGRVLGLALPLLGSLAVMAYALNAVSASRREVREVASLCEKAAGVASGARGQDPKLLERLRSQVQAAHELRAKGVERALPP
ncbi:MAG: hypothetical protein IT371_15700 [Deltaproteobacteria bacterium]|nr:hypothetical protein [Deltaproteobacteria bacterium]